jgi:hypothetical protein
MSKKDLGLQKLIDTIGRDFCYAHKDAACFSWGDTEKGLFCFLGIDLHPERAQVTLSVDIDEWDIYATCYVTDTEIIMGKCRLPQDVGDCV